MKSPQEPTPGEGTTFIRSIRIATKAFQDDPLSSPLISNWNRVESAMASFLELTSRSSALG